MMYKDRKNIVKVLLAELKGKTFIRGILKSKMGLLRKMYNQNKLFKIQ